MPELPEVETVRRGLFPVMQGARIVALALRRPDLRFPFPPDFALRVVGRTITGLGRRAKYLLIDLEDDQTIIAHLGMSGSFRIEPDGATPDDPYAPGVFHHPRSKDERHDHALFKLDGPAGAMQVVYNDPRRFGFMLLAQRSRLDDQPALRDLGPEPLGNSLGPDWLARRFAGKVQPVKLALLDQRNIAGLGNIYVCEALWRAGIAPDTPAARLLAPDGAASERLVTLTGAIRCVIAEAIEAGGSSLRDHIRTDGTLGYFQHSFRVYDREGEPCPACAAPVLRVVQGGRSTFYCGQCQT